MKGLVVYSDIKSGEKLFIKLVYRIYKRAKKVLIFIGFLFLGLPKIMIMS